MLACTGSSSIGIGLPLHAATSPPPPPPPPGCCWASAALCNLIDRCCLQEDRRACGNAHDWFGNRHISASAKLPLAGRLAMSCFDWWPSFSCNLSPLVLSAALVGGYSNVTLPYLCLGSEQWW
eukprot:1158816-Pelagomonas_calceolata.AAC.8